MWKYAKFLVVLAYDDRFGFIELDKLKNSKEVMLVAKRVVVTKAVRRSQEVLQVLTVFEEGKWKQEVRKENSYSKQHGVIY